MNEKKYQYSIALKPSGYMDRMVFGPIYSTNDEDAIEQAKQTARELKGIANWDVLSVQKTELR